jgi:hypothetical protein
MAGFLGRLLITAFRFAACWFIGPNGELRDGFCSLNLGIPTGAVGAGTVEVVEAGRIEAGRIEARLANGLSWEIQSGWSRLGDGLGRLDRGPIACDPVRPRPTDYGEVTKTLKAPSDELPNVLQLEGQAGMRLLHKTGLMMYPTAGLYQSSRGRRLLPE